jgi:uncharacterized protein CbrC (UPF0167 family)
MNLPLFKYHPDPVGTGSIEAREALCVCCGRTSEYIYVGPVYGETDLDGLLCPWCIANGLAHEKFGVEFTDRAAVGGYDWATRKAVSQEVKDEVANRTPGFSGWQQERWLVHCNDACEFHGPSGKGEIESYRNPELLNSLRADMAMNEEDFGHYFNALDKERGPTAYVFRCLHCGQYLGYSDFW